jgi:mannitol/fructose-specific phosphotransferase system IIA component (Ntr-type)
MGLVAVKESLLMVGAAVLIYFLYGRRKHEIEFALLHLIERIIDKKMTSDTLENELKQVIIDRDELKIDRFHGLVEDSVVMDFKERVSLNAFLEFLADETTKDIHIEKNGIIELFKERERAGSTAITPFVAIPHIIIPGEDKFKLVVARCKEGIQFNEEKNAVKAVFVLFGTKDERAFHLKALSAIAYIVQSRQFETAWMNAKNKQQLKDILLLTERKR